MALPVIISTWSFGLRGNDAAWPGLRAGGAAIDAVEAAARFLEADEEVDSVGYGGLPDESGAVSLDASIMLAPNRCGSVCAVQHHLHVITIARAVMERTPHLMLAGDGADRFADEIGEPRRELLSPKARQSWMEWKENPRVIDQSHDRGRAPVRPLDDGKGGALFERERILPHDTISTLALDAHDTLAGSCSTSGTPYKRPGRVGDSPIIGHGLYVLPGVGAAAATGTGELISGVCGSFLIVEMIRRGASAVDAIKLTLKRIRDSYELRDEHQTAFIALDSRGEYASGALRAGFRASITMEGRHEVIEPDVVMIEADSVN